MVAVFGVLVVMWLGAGEAKPPAAILTKTSDHIFARYTNPNS